MSEFRLRIPGAASKRPSKVSRMRGALKSGSFFSGADRKSGSRAPALQIWSPPGGRLSAGSRAYLAAQNNVRTAPEGGFFGRLVARYRAEHGREKQWQSDDNMPALLAQETSRLGRGSMNADFSPVAPGCSAAIVAVRYNKKRLEFSPVDEMPPAQRNALAESRHDQAAEHA